MEVYVGTSGWRYFWNEGNSLEWYVEKSGLNSVELNASFYRFPFKNMIKSWKEKGNKLRWCIKVSRLVTHIHKFNEEGIDIFKRFRELFEPMEDIIHFYLFQLPPSFKPYLKGRINEFIRKIGMNEKIAIEPRNSEWFKEENYMWFKELNITFVSIDAPKLPRDTIYLRFHGRESWYSHNYTRKELEVIKEEIIKKSPEKVFLFFNNDVDMLKNARLMKELFKE